MRFHWLLLSFLSIFLFCSPAKAGKILSWEFKQQDNNLVFITDEGVQPKAQLLSNPTRLVIDLPGTSLGRETVKENYQGAIRGFRIGQPEPEMSRIVIEFAPGYTVDSKQVKFRGLSSTQWKVEFPEPRITSVTAVSQPDRTDISSLPPVDLKPPLPNDSESEVINDIDDSDEDNESSPRVSMSDSLYVKPTRNGFIVSIDGSRKNQIETKRDGDRIEFVLKGVTLPADLDSQSIAVNQYGVSEIKFNQTSATEATMSLQVEENSPNWLATFSRIKGLILVPRGELPITANTSESIVQKPPKENQDEDLETETDPVQVEEIELLDDDSQLLIRGDRDLKAATTKQDNGIYEIKIDNAELTEDFQGPQLKIGSPISQVRVRQEDSTVLIAVTTRIRYSLGQISSEEQGISFPIQRGASLLPYTDEALIPPQSIDVPHAEASDRPVLDPVVPNNRPLVVIDAGHGGEDSGAIGIGGLSEKDIILPISLDVAEILRKQGIEVQMTRDSDYFVSLEGRTDYANKIKADLFVSIHANSINLSRPDVNGLETYYYQNGRRLAEVIHWSILNGVDIENRGIRRARFYVLRHSVMPAVLVEVGFVTGAEDASNLKNPNHRRLMAEAISRGIIQYIKENKF